MSRPGRQRKLLSAEQYTVGWICALPLVELPASEAMFDEEHTTPDIDDRDDNEYSAGSIHGHNVIMTCLPTGRMGQVSAASAATNMLRSFKNVRIGLMVGIGGGIWSEKYDIRLGDIVVSRPVGTTGGVVQYGVGKAENEGFKRTGQLAAPHKAVLSAVGKMQSSHVRLEPLLMQYFDEIFTKYLRMKDDYSRPQSDDMFEKSHPSASAQESRKSDDAPLEKKRKTKRSVGQPLIHYGLIASGDQVVKSAAERDRIVELLKPDGDAICIEMEAGGLMNDFPCLVIRGICDYADGKKNDDWQPYAAAIAAAYAKELLLNMQVKEVTKAVPLSVSVLAQPDPQTTNNINRGNSSRGNINNSGSGQNFVQNEFNGNSYF